MLRPSQEAFVDHARRGNLVPLVRELLADMDTPLSLFRRLDDGRTSFLFESVEGGEKWGRFSFIGTGARAMFRARGRDVEWSEGGRTHARARRRAIRSSILRERLAALHPVHLDGVALPRFLGGAVGMISYDWVRFVERVPDSNPDETEMPDLWFVLPETIVVYDNVRKTAQIVRHVDVPAPAPTPRRCYQRGAAELEAVVRRLRAPLPAEEPRRAACARRWSCTAAPAARRSTRS